MTSKDLIIGFCLVQRVELLLKVNAKVRLNSDDLQSSMMFLQKALKRIPKEGILSDSVDKLKSFLVYLGDLVSIIGVDYLTSDDKDKVVDEFYSMFYDLTVSIAKVLTVEAFNYEDNLEQPLKDIVDICLNQGYYLDI